MENISACDANWTFYHPLNKINEKKIGHMNKLLPRREINLLTYNIFLRPPPVKNNISDHKDDRLEDFTRILHNFDIICLQECFGSYNSRKLQLIRAATKNGLFFFIDSTAPSFYSKYVSDGGLLILSRFPIVKYAFHGFNYGVVSDSLAQKGVLYAKIQVGKCFLHVFTSHTQSSYFHDTTETFMLTYRTRMDQIKQINWFISSIMKTEYSNEDTIVLCGDLNIDALQYHKNQPV